MNPLNNVTPRTAMPTASSLPAPTAPATPEPAPAASVECVSLSGAQPAAPAGIPLAATAAQGLAAAHACAAATVGGHAIGVSVADLLASRSAIEKGYHMPRTYIDGYYERRILPYQSHPTYTETDGAFYRGMYITVDELANIMTNGFEAWRNTWSAVGGQGVYLSTSQREADDYIFQSVDPSKKQAIGVVFKLERGDYAQLVDDPQCNATKTIYKSAGDVAPERLVDVYVRGQYGLERLADIVERARKGDIGSNEAWVHAFDGWFSR